MIGTVSPPLVIFVAMPGTDMGPHATWRNTAEIKQYLYGPVANKIKAALGGEVDLRIEKDKISQGVIHWSMFEEASEAPVYIADLTGANPNVYFELGVRWTLRKRVTVLVCQNENHDIKFNVSSNRYIPYGPGPQELELACETIVRAILEGLNRGSDGTTDSPVREYLDKNELHPENAGIHPETTGRDAPRGWLLRYFRTHTWTPMGPKKFRRQRTVVTSTIGYAGLAMTILFLGVFLGTSYGGTADPSPVPSMRPPEIGDAYPLPGVEFLAQFVNQSSGECIARNGIGTHPTDSEIPRSEVRGGNNGADIYQYGCGTGAGFKFDYPQVLVLVPLKDDSWMIRSSIKSKLCLQSDEKRQSAEKQDLYEHMEICDEGDDRQRWMLQSVGNAGSRIAVVRNRQTGRCLAHGGPPGGDPAYVSSGEAIPQLECQPEAKVEWLIRELVPFGDKECRDQSNIGIKNREAGFYMNHGDPNRPRMGNQAQMISLTRGGRSAHGCTVQIAGPAENCMEVPEKSPPDSEVVWKSCNGGLSEQQWVVESWDKSNGKNWLRFHSVDDTSRCLLQSGKDAKTATLTASPCNGDRSAQWAAE